MSSWGNRTEHVRASLAHGAHMSVGKFSSIIRGPSVKNGGRADGGPAKL